MFCACFEERGSRDTLMDVWGEECAKELTQMLYGIPGTYNYQYGFMSFCALCVQNGDAR